MRRLLPICASAALLAAAALPLTLAADAAPAGLSSPAVGSIFGAIDQLGLRLESKRGPVQVYVVEKIERPAEN